MKILNDFISNFNRKIQVKKDMREYLKIIKELDSNHIHYGYFTYKTRKTINKKEFVEAQNNISNLIISNIPKNVKFILDLGGGIGGISHDLKKRDYNPYCIVPDKILINEGKKRFKDIKFIKSTAEIFRLKDKFDLCIMIESFQFFYNKRKALRNILLHLKQKSYILILDEFSYSNEVSKNLPIEIKYINTLKKNNFNVIYNKDLSRGIIPTFDYGYNHFLQNNSKLAESYLKTKNEYLSNKRKYKLIIMIKNEKINKKHI